MKKLARSDKLEFGLKLACCRSVKATKEALAGCDGDIGAVREAELWLFAKHLAAGATGLPNAGAANAFDKYQEYWHEVAGLVDGE